MHELSLVQSILEIVTEQVASHRATAVERIELEIGTLAGVEGDAFDFAWDAAVKDTVLQDALRVTRKVQAVSRCDACQMIFDTESWYQPCPRCGEFAGTLLHGKELRVKSIVVS